MTLDSGTYVVKREKVVTHWPAPDHLGDGELLWENRTDAQGRALGTVQVKDALDRPVRSYLPPKGFSNYPSRNADGSVICDNYVKVDNTGAPVRNGRGEALGIRPGTALVEYADGTYEVLSDEYAMYQFEKSHEKVAD